MTTFNPSAIDENSEIIDPKIIVALDYAEAKSALNLVAQLDPGLCRLKVGKELFTASGPQLVETLVGKGFGVFLDLKFHDIPKTVEKVCKVASKLGVWMLNVHASGGLAMMEAARQGVADSGFKPRLIAVTVLTSMDQITLGQIGVASSLEDQVLRLAKLTQQAALDGVVCSALEVGVLRKALGQEFCLVTPGIRPALSMPGQSTKVKEDDQSRIMTPNAALQQGASYLVIGRPITQSDDPMAVLYSLVADIAME
ncbi:MAG: orotidine-5'-phosphate decarboxylase [Methylophilaceae bacterium]